MTSKNSYLPPPPPPQFQPVVDLPAPPPPVYTGPPPPVYSTKAPTYRSTYPASQRLKKDVGGVPIVIEAGDPKSVTWVTNRSNSRINAGEGAEFSKRASRSLRFEAEDRQPWSPLK